MTTRSFTSFEKATAYAKSLANGPSGSARIVRRGIAYVVEIQSGIASPSALLTGAPTTSGTVGVVSKAAETPPKQKLQLQALRQKPTVIRKLPKDGDPYRDALDHPARLHGSLGSGKRK